jgi:hypothetical protein
MSGVSSVVHLNVVDFLASVAVAKDRSLKDKAFVVAGSSSSRSVVLDLSRRAREEGLTEGMLLSAAQRRVPGILALPADETACALAEAEMRRISARYAPAVEAPAAGTCTWTLREHGGSSVPTSTARRASATRSSRPSGSSRRSPSRRTSSSPK